MPKTLKLTDLYVVGKSVKVESPQGVVTVWLQKLSPVDHESALRRANAKRAKTLAMARHSDSNEENRDVFMNELFDIAPDRESVINLLCSEDLAKVYQAREAELAAEDEWSEDDYLQGLKDSWNDEMYERFVLDAEDEEALKVKNELDRFATALEKRIEQERKSLARDYETFSDEKLTEKAVDILIVGQSNMEWLAEYRKCELWLGVRDKNDHTKKYFKERVEVDNLATPVLGQLIQEYQSLNVETVEGKD